MNSKWFSLMAAILWLAAGVHAATDESPWPNNDRNADGSVPYNDADQARLGGDDSVNQMRELYFQFKDVSTLEQANKIIDVPQNLKLVTKFLDQHAREYNTKNNVYEQWIRKAFTMLCASKDYYASSLIADCLKTTPNFYDKRVYQELMFYQRLEYVPLLIGYLKKWEAFYPVPFKDDKQQSQAVQVFCWLYGDVKESSPKELVQLVTDSYQRLKAKYQGNEDGLKFLKEMRKNFPFLDKAAYEKDTAPVE
jgi:hypothetical protein